MTPSNATYARFCTDYAYGTTYKSDVNFALYYSPEQGGEGFSQVYPFVAPIRIDTGNEVLRSAGSVKDVKLPSGVITRNIGVVDMGTLNWEYNAVYGVFLATVSDIRPNTGSSDTNYISCAKYATSTISSASSSPDKSIYPRTTGSTSGVGVKDSAYTDATTFKTAMSGVYLFYELATPTTEQGTPFSEYAPINDYSYMAWFDTDGNLVSIPQGCKLFYPVDYKGFVDDLVMYTNGDATALAKNEDITDTALNARGYYKMQDLLTAFGANGMVGGTLRQMFANKESISFLSTNVIDMGDLTYTTDGLAITSTTAVTDKLLGSQKILCTRYKETTSATGDMVDGEIKAYASNNTFIFKDSVLANKTPAEIKQALKGVLIAYEKA